MQHDKPINFQIIISLLFLVACALKDDFGRSKQSQLQADAIEAVGAIQEHTGLLSNEAAFHIPYSGDELTLRMTLKHFRKPIPHSNIRKSATANKRAPSGDLTSRRKCALTAPQQKTRSKKIMSKTAYT